MPAFWAASGAKAMILTNTLQRDDIQGSMFIPQIRYPDATEVEVTVTDWTFAKKNNMFVVKQAVVITLVQSSFQFSRYPGDTQNIQFRLYVYPFDSSQAIMQIYKEGIFFSTLVHTYIHPDRNNCRRMEKRFFSGFCFAFLHASH
jgi:hypothetical protein